MEGDYTPLKSGNWVESVCETRTFSDYIPNLIQQSFDSPKVFGFWESGDGNAAAFVRTVANAAIIAYLPATPLCGLRVELKHSDPEV